LTEFELFLPQEFSHVSFSHDSRYLVAVLSQPDHVIHYWNWEASKLLGTVKVSSIMGIGSTVNASLGHLRVNQVQLNPWDNTQVAVVGKSLCKVLKYTEGGIRPLAQHKVDNKVSIFLIFFFSFWASFISKPTPNDGYQRM
jgi:hypothetical protein